MLKSLHPETFELVTNEVKKVEQQVKMTFFKETEVNFDVDKAVNYLEELKKRKKLEPQLISDPEP
jgi:hypothetical protein